MAIELGNPICRCGGETIALSRVVVKANGEIKTGARFFLVPQRRQILDSANKAKGGVLTARGNREGVKAARNLRRVESESPLLLFSGE